MAKVAVLLGGKSAERPISLTTGKAIAEALRKNGHDVTEIDAAQDLCAKLVELAPEVAFIALHGRFGEDGTVQGLLEILGIPYTGSGVTASAVAMDKVMTKHVFESFGVPSPAFMVLDETQGPADITLDLPYVVKPPREGSTIGISIVKEAGKVAEAVAEGRKYDKTLLIEKFVKGRELTVGVIDGQALPIVEIAPVEGFYDFNNKYTPGKTNYTCPANLTDKDAQSVTRAGVLAYKALGCSGAARVDVLLDDDGNPWVLEANTIPGMTPTSLLPKAAKAFGLSFEELVERMLKGASLKA